MQLEGRRFLVSARYLGGRGGLDADERKAAAWCKKAAKQGHAGAQANLGGLYEGGRGVAQDSVKAISWYVRRAGTPRVSALIREAGRLARRW